MLGLISLVFPADGIRVSEGLRIEFPTVAELVQLDTNRGADMGEILANLENADSLAALDSARSAEAKRLEIVLNLQFPEGNKEILHPFFAELKALEPDQPSIRVLHYGDSQIEGDRMTGYIRNEFQTRFGGSGPGLVSLNPLVPTFSLKQSRESNWQRFTYFGTRDPEVTHSAYGPLANFSRFIPINLPPLPKPEKRGRRRRRRPRHPMQESWVKFEPNSGSYRLARTWEQFRLFYGKSRAPVLLNAVAEGQVLYRDTLEKEGLLHTTQYTFSAPPTELMLKFKGRDSPNFYGVSLESSSGVLVDNISMRGSAGTLFSSLDQELLRETYAQLNVKLLLLQFGGNAVPSIRDSAHAASYGKSFGRQIQGLKKLIPGVTVIVLGPADMSVKEKGGMVTHPFLEPVRDGLKQASFDAGAAYFDLYEVMGGRNSMPKWIEEGLGSPDYIHLSPQGAKILAEAFMKAFWRDFEAYEAGGGT